MLWCVTACFLIVVNGAKQPIIAYFVVPGLAHQPNSKIALTVCGPSAVLLCDPTNQGRQPKGGTVSRAKFLNEPTITYYPTRLIKVKSYLVYGQEGILRPSTLPKVLLFDNLQTILQSFCTNVGLLN